MGQYVVRESTKDDADFIEQRIVEYNEANVPFELTVPFSKINKHVRDEDGTIIAGINCVYYSWRCLYIDALWVRDDLRKTGLGSKLLLEIENTAREYSIHLIHLDTFDFQAKDFYVKHGYEIHGVLEDCPLSHQRFYLQKRID
ncbi:GNAT family N-acetyltransferase [Brevibacillus sp. AG]|uniref:GNAT family N-acetyltransferase n=1 Tax=Brevibacillus sp. AG TaxID=3020891 RepID=UPI0008529F06|nr:GNAT family N-acetyltransferase [Brevibacillus sp. AG]MDC0761497.1 GNAT family N-acetyltransferase [Brevibacillus sp. AG]